MAYVPPHLRGKPSTPRTGASVAQANFYSREDIGKYVGCSAHELCTLSAPTSSPGTLRAILLHDVQHPEWKSAHKLLCKTNLEALSSFNTDNDEVAQRPRDRQTAYPLFGNMPFLSGASRSKLEFLGWWHVVNVQYLQPNSVELVELLEKKFNPRGQHGGHSVFASHRAEGKPRTREAWMDSLSKTWAIVSLEKDASRAENPLETLRDAEVAELAVGPNDEGNSTFGSDGPEATLAIAENTKSS